MATKKRKKTRKKNTPKRRFWRPSGRLLVKLFLALVVLLLAGVVYLDATVKHKFAGKKWALPALVYARPLELYKGMQLTRYQLEQELKALGYQFEGAAKRPGTVLRRTDSYDIHSRGFQFTDGFEPARHFRLRISNGVVKDLTGLDGKPLSLLRLEPLHIGGIYPKHNEDRLLVRLQDVPPELLDGLISVEDRDFYQHSGVSVRSIARAFLANVRSGSVVQGGSTLTQQLVKNFFLTRERSLSRKVWEAIMSLLLEAHFSKAEILEAYLNEVYLGQDGHRAIHGFGLASEYYFNQPLAELQFHQVALLIAIVKGPTYYDPWRYPERAIDRRNLVLGMLGARGQLTENQTKKESMKALGVGIERGSGRGAHPAYLDLVRRQLRRDYSNEDLSSEGLQIFTALDPIVQRQAEQSLQTTLSGLEQWHQLSKGKEPNKKVSPLEAAMVVTQVDNGEVLAVVGGSKPHYAGFNRALDAVRPIGSLIKPAVFLAALSQPDAYTLASLVKDERFTVEISGQPPWQPRNFDRKNHGEVTLHSALSHSYNQATARLGMEIGLETVLDSVKKMGVSRSIPKVPAILLGSVELSPVEVATMYQTITANGFATPLRAIRAVLDSEGKPLSRYPFTVKQQFSAEAMHLLHYSLQEVMREGTGKTAYRKLPPDFAVAGKTGTTNDLRDSWFAGFAGDLSTVVWVGRDDNGTTPFTGAGGALRIWADFMAAASQRSLEYIPPERIEHYWVDEATGLLSKENCKNVRYLPFIAGSAPTQKAHCVKRLDSVVDWFDQLFR